MSYIGRVVGIGITNYEDPVLLYGLSGRSASSRSRKASVHGSRVSIEPYGEMTPEQLAEAQRLIYDAIMTSNASTVGVVSNGKQTGSIYRRYLKMHDASNTARNAISKALKYWGHEGKVGDRYNTPRVAGMVDVRGDDAAIGIITAENEKSGVPAIACRDYADRGFMCCLSTYTGNGEEPQPNKGLEASKFYRIEGKTVEDLAQEMYDFMDPNFAVSSAAALWNPSKEKWELAVKNKT